MTDERVSADLLGRATVPSTAVSVSGALACADAGAIARAALDVAIAGRGDAALMEAIATLVTHDTDGLDGAFVSAVACLRVLPDHSGLRAALPVARCLDVVAHGIAGRQQRSPPLATDVLALEAFALTLAQLPDTAATLASDAAAAELAVRRVALGDVEPGAIAEEVVDLLYLRAGRCAHLAPIVLATVQVARVAERAVAVDALARTARTLVLRGLPRNAAFEDVVTPIVASALRIHGAQDPDKAGAFQEARFRPHLLGAKPDVLVRAVGKALAFGVPRGRVASSLCLAAAERVLRFDAAIARSARRQETWLDMGWLLQICEAIRTLGVLHDRPGWLALLLHGALWTRAASPLDAATPQALPEPETLARTWDHGPEIARVTGAMLRGDGRAAMAVLRGYLMMVLPEQPLSAEIASAALEDRAASAAEQGALLATVVAALASFGAAAGLPHRDLLLCAALHVWTAPQPPRAVFALAHAEVDRAEGALPADTTSVLPWLAHRPT